MVDAEQASRRGLAKAATRIWGPSGEHDAFATVPRS
jgi:hypothetical protein